MRQIALTRSQVTLVDDEDFGWLSKSNWHAQWTPNTKSFYAARKSAPGVLRMHRAIWEYHHGPIPAGLQIDHADRHTLDNRQSNLRLATRSQQAQNRGLRSDNSSGYRGVYLDTARGKWRAQIAIDGRIVSLGSYTDPVPAARAYDAAARIHLDAAFAQLNFPNHTTSDNGGSKCQRLVGAV